MFDLVSGYKHVTIPPDEKMTLEELRKAGYLLDHHAWLGVSYANMLLDTLNIFVPAHPFSRNNCWSSGNGSSYNSSSFKSPAHGENCYHFRPVRCSDIVNSAEIAGGT